MADFAKWKDFKEERTHGWTASADNGVPMEIWVSIDEPAQFRVTVNDVLQPEFYPTREEAIAAAENLAASIAAPAKPI